MFYGDQLASVLESWCSVFSAFSVPGMYYQFLVHFEWVVSIMDFIFATYFCGSRRFVISTERLCLAFHPTILALVLPTLEAGCKSL